VIALLLACSAQPQPAPDHDHAEQGRHGASLQDRASRVFGSDSAPNDALSRFISGDDAALDPAQKAGMEVFLISGCGHCHAGPGLGGLDGVTPSLRGLDPAVGLRMQDHEVRLGAQDLAAIQAFLEVLG
jgi:mono/diheme cytochrome c family protein